MKNIINVFKLFTFIAVLILPATAQQSQKLPSDKTDFIKNGLLTKYDPAKNETSIYVYPELEIYESERNFLTAENLRMTVGFSFSGKEFVSKPSSVEFGFISEVKTNWRFEDEKERKLTIVVDEQKFELGTLTRIKTKTVPRVSRSNLRFVENLAMMAPFETLERIAKAKKVTVKIGGYGIKLRKEHLEVLRELLLRAS